MVQIFEVYAQNEENFSVIVSKDGTIDKFYRPSVFEAMSILKIAGVKYNFQNSMSLTEFKRAYKS